MFLNYNGRNVSSAESGRNVSSAESKLEMKFLRTLGTLARIIPRYTPKGPERIANTLLGGELNYGKSPTWGADGSVFRALLGYLLIVRLMSPLKRGNYMVFLLVVWRLESVNNLAQCLAHRKGWIKGGDYCYYSLLANWSRIHLPWFTWVYSNLYVGKWGAPYRSNL